MGVLKGSLVQDEYAYRITNITKAKYQNMHQKALINNVVFSPTFKNPDVDNINMVTWYFGSKKDLDNFLRAISLLN